MEVESNLNRGDARDQAKKFFFCSLSLQFKGYDRNFI